MPQLKKQLGWAMIRWIGLGGIAVGIYFAYRLVTAYKSKTRTRKNEKNIKSPFLTQQANFSNYYFDKNLQIQLLQEKLPCNLTVKHIYLFAPTIVQDQFIKYTREIRKRRRLIRKTNEEAYIDLIIHYQSEVQELLQRSRYELIEYLSIHPDQLAQMEENYDLIEDLNGLEKQAQMILRQQILKHGKIKVMSQEKLIMILNDQIAFVKNKMYDRIKKKLQKDITLTQNQILFIIRALCDDIIYEKYGYQPEDIDKKIRQTSVDTGERDQCQSIMEADIVDFNFQSLNSSQLEIQSGCGELGESIPTLGKTTDDKEETNSLDHHYF